MKQDNKVEIVDGLSKAGKTNAPHPSLDEEVDELGLEVDDDTVDDEIADGEEDITEDVDAVEDEETDDDEEVADDTDSEDESDDEETEEPAPKKTVDTDREYASVVSDIKGYHNQLELISDSQSEKPERPSDDLDDEAMTQYRHDLAVWKSETKRFETQRKVIQEKVKQACSRQEAMFRTKHSKESLDGFEQWMGEAKEFQAAFVTGRKTLESLYRMYKADVGITEDSVKTINTAKKKGVTVKPVKLKSSATHSKGGSVAPFPKQFKYANIKENQQEARQLLKQGNPITGRKMTLKEIDSMFKTDHKYRRGILL